MISDTLTATQDDDVAYNRSCSKNVWMCSRKTAAAPEKLKPIFKG